MPTVEAKKRIYSSVRGLGILVEHSWLEPVAGQAVRTVASSQAGGERLKTGETVLGAIAFRHEIPAVQEYGEPGIRNPALGGYEKS